MNQKVFFIRHGESTANRDRVFAGHWDVELTELGEKQAIEAAKRAKIDGIQVDVIISSPLRRAFRTAELIALELGIPPAEIIVSDYAKEKSGGKKTEGVSYSVLDAMTEEQVADFFSDGETDESVLGRVHELWKLVKSYNGKNVLIVAHAGIGARFLSVFLEIELDFSRFEIPNAQIMEINANNVRNLYQ